MKAILIRAWNIEGIVNKVSVFVKGPGWSPGKPRLGELKDIPEVSPEGKLQTLLPLIYEYCDVSKILFITRASCTDIQLAFDAH